MVEDVTSTTEEYLENIYRLQERDGVARTSEMAKMLSVVPGTITNTVERLEKEGWITHIPYKGVKLTREGHKIALQVIKKHRLSERLLTDILDIEWDRAHEAACRLEHGFTDEIVKDLEKALGFPKTCPHGNPIPTDAENASEEERELLTNLNPSEGGVIIRIMDETPELLNTLVSLGLKPGLSFEIVKNTQFKDSITIKFGGENHILDHDVASSIGVKKN